MAEQHGPVPPSPRILVVDDVVAMAEQYAYDLKRLGGYRTRIAGGGREAIAAMVEEEVDCVILDLEMPGMDGFEVLRTMHERDLELPVIVYTGTGDFERCAQAIRLGAYSFIDKAESMQRVVQEVRNALERGRLVREVRTLRARVDTESTLIGESAPMRKLREQIRVLAPIPSPVLILGESGSGKELVAHDLHAFGTDPKAPFVPVNCAALPEALVESELFGHERGAFTGAERARRGAFELAGRGTLFLDEIGELPLPVQAKLLRALEAREITRLGAEKPTPVLARVVAATHRDLESDVESKRFRQDLYFRFNVHILNVPPLRDRPSDVPLLVEHFLGTICERFGMRRKSIDDDALRLLSAYDWARNNVRELRNIIERLVIAAGAGDIEVDHLPPEIAEAAGDTRSSSLHAKRADAERQIIIDALDRNDGHVTNTARELGLADHASLLKIMRRLGIRRS
ncbi:MAG TPA: sigma-54 dependent transcriptional regulator [Longimicrobiales bacterium]|nr:sigma-54 dependent transcriptional regulator [Longimicrobiales bacterium]